MAFPQGLNFRATLAFVTDGANENAELALTGDVDYPRTTAQGNTVGWESLSASNIQTRDRNSANDRRLAGTHFTQTATDIDKYRVDLSSSGSWNIRFAAGEASYARSVVWDLYDTTTLRANLTTGSTSAANSFKDATNTEYTAANWPASNSSRSITFSTTILRLQSTGVSAFVAHLRLDSAAVATMIPGIFPNPPDTMDIVTVF